MYSISKVRELTETLERNLSFGSAVKKPAGGVSLHFQGIGDERGQPQRKSGQRSSKLVEIKQKQNKLDIFTDNPLIYKNYMKNALTIFFMLEGVSY